MSRATMISDNTANTHPVVRRDLNLYNEANGWLITSASRSGLATATRCRGCGSKSWRTAIADGGFLPMQVVEDNPINVRVVVNDALAPAEQSEWVDRLSWKLAVPDGRLVFAAGSEYVCEGEDDARFVREVEIPAGTYRVDVYTYLHGVNGRLCLQHAGVEDAAALREYWQDTRAGEAVPAWLLPQLRDADQDEEESADDALSAAQKRSWRVWEQPAATVTSDDAPEMQLVDFLVHLTPLMELPSMPRLEDGWFECPHAPRKPERAPLGLHCIDLEGLDPDEAGTESTCTSTAAMTMIDHVRERALTPLVESIELPITDELVLPFWLAALCLEATRPVVRVDLRGQPFQADWKSATAAFAVEPTAEGFIVHLAERGHPVRHLHRLASMLDALPDGSVIELDTCAPNESPEEEAGLHRYRGQVRGGQWVLEACYPAVEAYTLRSALQLAREVDAGGPVALTNKAEGELLMAKLREHGTCFGYYATQGPALWQEGSELFAANVYIAEELGRFALRSRFAGTWEYDDLEWDLDFDDDSPEAMARMFELLQTAT